MSLEEEIRSKRSEIATDGYQMSIGELANLYKDHEVDVHPEFQRVYRWSATQKTALVESILLGIPLPSIFVAQRSDGVWDVVDGVQRLSTILQTMGELIDDEGRQVAPLTLEATKFLPSLSGKQWEHDDPGRSLTAAQRIDFKRAKLDVKIIKRESDPTAKYELFQRLNAFGSQLTPQEVRNCLLVSVNRDLYYWLRDLTKLQSFQDVLALPERSVLEQYDMELALRFLIFRRLPEDRLQSVGNLHQFLTEELIAMATTPDFPRAQEEESFRTTFNFLSEAVGDDAFRKYNPTKDRFEGPFLATAFEVVGMGIGYHAPEVPNSRPYDVADRIRSFWADDRFTRGFSTGVRADTRMAITIPFGRQHFAA